MAKAPLEGDPPNLKTPFDQFYERSRNQLRVWLFNKFQHRGLSEAEAEEIVNQVCAEIAKQYNHIYNLELYCFRILIRHADAYLKQKSKEKDAASEFLRRIAQERWLAKRIDEILKVAENHLDKREYTLFELVYVERRYTHKELAELWGYSHGYMRQYASKVMEKVRNVFEEQGGDELLAEVRQVYRPRLESNQLTDQVFRAKKYDHDPGVDIDGVTPWL